MTPNQVQLAYDAHHPEATQAFEILNSYYSAPIPRVPGCDTVVRLAVRIAAGKSVEGAAASEYIYRWKLAVLPGDQVTCGSRVVNQRGERADAVSIFGTPHVFGL